MGRPVAVLRAPLTDVRGSVDSIRCGAEPSWNNFCHGLIAAKLTGPAVHDARIAAICVSHGIGELWRVDRGFSRMAAIRVRNPLLKQKLLRAFRGGRVAAATETAGSEVGTAGSTLRSLIDGRAGESQFVAFESALILHAGAVAIGGDGLGPGDFVPFDGTVADLLFAVFADRFAG